MNINNPNEITPESTPQEIEAIVLSAMEDCKGVLERMSFQKLVTSVRDTFEPYDLETRDKAIAFCLKIAWAFKNAAAQNSMILVYANVWGAEACANMIYHSRRENDEEMTTNDHLNEFLATFPNDVTEYIEGFMAALVSEQNPLLRMLSAITDMAKDFEIPDSNTQSDSNPNLR